MGCTKALARACMLNRLQVFLLILIFRVGKLAREAVHDRQLSQLRPEEVNLLRVVLLLEEPPKAVLEESSNHHLIVALAYIAFVVEALRFSVINLRQCFIYLVHVAHSMLADLLLIVARRLVRLGYEFIFLSQKLANEEDEFLFDSIRILTNFQRGRH